MKKLILLTAVSGLVLASCDDSLETESMTLSNTANFPTSEADAAQMLTAAYASLNHQSAAPLTSYFMASNIASDDQLAGGCPSDNETKAIEHLTLYNVDQYEAFWKVMYQGIYRTNVAIESFDNFPWSSTDKRNQAVGEAYFLRGFYHFWLCQMFGNIPMQISSAVVDKPDDDAATVVMPQVMADFQSAANLMAGTKSSGHVNKYAAEAMLARAYLFYSGVYGNQPDMLSGDCSVTIPADQEGIKDATLNKATVAKYLKDAKDCGVYKLLDDFRSLWQYSHSLVASDYEYTKDVTETFKNGNEEEIFGIQYMNYAGWTYDNQMGYSNQFTLYMGLRCSNNGGESTFPFGQGWGMAPASPNTVDAWKAAEPTDKRINATILDCQKELEKYYFDDNCEDGGFAVKKYLPVTCMKNKEDGHGTPWDTFWCYISDSFTSSNDNNMQGSHYEDVYLIRYADVLLMYAELANDQASFDKVRARAGLGSKALTFDNLKAERRWEFLGEGLRWSDMRRFSGSSITETSYIATCLEGEAGAIVKDGSGADIPMAHLGGGGSWKARLVATQALFAKPYTQIALSNYMTQNAGWVNQSDYQYKGY